MRLGLFATWMCLTLPTSSRERLRYAMNQASISIRRESLARPETREMGTTAVVMVVDGGQAHFAHVGDSRAYLYRGGRLTRLTRDHTVVQQEIDAGETYARFGAGDAHKAYPHTIRWLSWTR